MAIAGYRIVAPDGSSSNEFDSDTLVHYARQGTIQPNTYVYDPAAGQAVAAARLAVLQGVFAPDGVSAPYAAGYPAPQRRAPDRGIFVALAGAGLVVVMMWVVFLAGLHKVLDATQTITTADGRYALSIPKIWRSRDSNNPGMVEYLSRTEGMLIAPLTREPATDAELNDRTGSVESLFAEKKGSIGDLSRPVRTKIAGYPARLIEYDDIENDGQYHFRHALIGTPDGVYDIAVFGPDTDQVRADQDKMLASFHASR